MKNTPFTEAQLNQARMEYLNGTTPEELYDKLAAKGVIETERELVVSALKKIRHEHAVTSGVKLLITGALILVGGFLITFFLHYANINFNWIMYGMTLVGSSVALFGLSKMIS